MGAIITQIPSQLKLRIDVAATPPSASVEWHIAGDASSLARESKQP